MPLPRCAALSIVILKDSANSANVETGVAVIVPFESPSNASIDLLIELVAADMERVNATILSRTGSEVTMIPEVANHLISSGGKRLRPMLTLAMAGLSGYSGEGHIKLAASVEFMHTATLLHDDVVDESELRRGKLSARMLWGNEASVLVGDFLLGQAFRMMVDVGSLEALDVLSGAACVIAEGEASQPISTPRLLFWLKNSPPSNCQLPIGFRRAKKSVARSVRCCSIALVTCATMLRNAPPRFCSCVLEWSLPGSFPYRFFHWLSCLSLLVVRSNRPCLRKRRWPPLRLSAGASSAGSNR